MLLNKHGTFYIRNGWPTKILDALTLDTHIFSPNNELIAVDTIGVGRVMIKAMRYWVSVLGLAVEGKDQQGITCTLTPLSVEIIAHDLYCQDRGTLWLLHRNLARDLDNATAWSWAFNIYDAKSFTKDEFSAALYSYIQREGGSYAKNAVEKEFDCFKNTYVSDKDFDVSKIIEEDTIPFFAPLKLIDYKSSGRFEKSRSSIKDIPIDILFYCILEDNAEHLLENRQISIDHLMEENNQVCKYMNLSYSTLIEMLQQLENSGYLKLYNNFGNRYIEVQVTDTHNILHTHYQTIGR